MYSQINDEYLSDYRYLSPYQVPFDSTNNIGMLWNYEIDKALDTMKKTLPKYVAQVVSR